MKSIELFAGGGGLAIGTALAGFRKKTVFEWDNYSCDTLRLNKRHRTKPAANWTVNQGDVADVDFSSYAGEVDFVSGGPPCQPFSLGGKHRGHRDDRNMFPHAVRAIREVRPKAFLFENVKGLLRKNFSTYYNYIIHQFRHPTCTTIGDEEWPSHLARLERLHTKGTETALQYNVVFQLVNAVNYGAPQHRWRVFIVGIRADLGADFSFPLPTHSEDALLYAKWVSGEYWDEHHIPKSKRPAMPPRLQKRVTILRAALPELMLPRWRTVRDAISDLPKISAGRTSKQIANHYLNPGARSYLGHNGSPYDEPAKALKAGDHGVPGGENTLRFEDGTVRYFSVRECARLQTFPDDWIFEGSWTETMRQLGNAVPVVLAKAVAVQLNATLDRGGVTRTSSRLKRTR